MPISGNFETVERQQRHVVPGRVTVVTAVFNAERTLPRCIESVLGQDYPDIEYILMDGGSTDGSVEIIKRYADRVIWRSERDKGIYDAWNKSLALATGEWIAFVGSDDFYLPGAVTAYMNVASVGDLEYISSQVRWIQVSGGSKTIGRGWTWPHFQSLMTVAHVGSMHRYTLFERYGTYDPSYRIVGDYELLLRARGNLRAGFLPQLTVAMEAGGASDSHAALAETKRAKSQSGGRPRTVAYIEWWIARTKLFVRHAFRKR